MADTKPLNPADDPPFSPYQDSPTSPNHLLNDEIGHIDIRDDNSKPEDPLLHTEEAKVTSPTFNDSHPYDPHAVASPSKSTASFETYDEEKLKPEEPVPPKLTDSKKRQRILDITQRATTLALSVIVLGIMSHAYITFLKNKDVTVDGIAIYPTFMQLWPTYMMIAAGAVTVALNAFVLGWRIHGSIKDFHREEMYNKYWDYALHGINGLVWLGTSTTFGVSKNWGPAADPNVLWGYTCSPTASNLTDTYPHIVKFYVQCELQTVSFWTAVSSVMVEVFSVAAKVFVK